MAALKDRESAGSDCVMSSAGIAGRSRSSGYPGDEVMGEESGGVPVRVVWADFGVISEDSTGRTAREVRDGVLKQSWGALHERKPERVWHKVTSLSLGRPSLPVACGRASPGKSPCRPIPEHSLE